MTTKRPQPFVVEYGERVVYGTGGTALNARRYVSQASAIAAIHQQLDTLQRSAAKFNKEDVQLFEKYKEQLDQTATINPGSSKTWFFEIESVGYRLQVKLRREYLGS